MQASIQLVFLWSLLKSLVRQMTRRVMPHPIRSRLRRFHLGLMHRRSLVFALQTCLFLLEQKSIEHTWK